jgi:hypothetical protein
MSRQPYLLGPDIPGGFYPSHSEGSIMRLANTSTDSDLIGVINELLVALGLGGLPAGTDATNLANRLRGVLAVVKGGGKATPAHPNDIPEPVKPGGLAMANKVQSRGARRLEAARDVAKRRGISLEAAAAFLP